jgi:hypothetical protein
MGTTLIRSLASVSALVSLAGLAGCTPIDTGLGDVSRANQALQVINPDPVADDTPPAASGARAAAAAERYRKGQVKPPAVVSTTATAAGGGSGGPPK